MTGPAITVRPFADAEWRTYRALRIDALRDAPDAFGGTLAQALARPDRVWIDRLASRGERHLPLVGEIDGAPAGLAWGMVDADATDIAHVTQMWVAPAARGQGMAQALLSALVDWGRASRLRALELRVTASNAAAIRLYESAGFHDFAAPEPLRDGSDILVRPMRRPL